MLGIELLRNPVQPYDWGSRTAIAELRGEPPSPGPQAELWIGSHPQASSELALDGTWRSLAAVVAERPAEVLGAAAAGRGETALPFLLKVLAADEPLSIQAHPDAAQAAAGCRREDERGLRRDSPERSYRDASAKPELVCALRPFVLLSGFRPPPAIADLLVELGLGEALDAAALRDGGSPALRAFFTAWMRRPAAEAARLVATAAARAEGRDDAVGRWIGRLARRFPGDRGVLAPAFLELHALAPGEAVFTGPGVLHTYLEGVGVELMAASDNVLRGGLTRKRVDVPGLLEVLRFEPRSTRLEPETPAAGVARFRAPDGGLVLTRVRLASDRPGVEAGGGPALLVVTAGAGAAVELASGRRVPFRRGDGLLVPAAVRGFNLEGEGEVFVASGG